MAVSLATDFPGGNGIVLDTREEAGKVVVHFAADPKNCPEAMWFHFRVCGLAGRALRCVLVNAEQTLGGGDWSRNRPVFRTGGDWTRSELPLALTSPGGRSLWAWDIPGNGDAIEVAHCFPYQAADLAATVEQLGGTFSSTTIGVTLGGRPLTRLFSSVADGSKPAVYLTARHHAGETPGSWVLDGLLRSVAGDERLRSEIVWWAVPFVNFDDVVIGSYGKDPFPHDCNRGYGPNQPRRVEAAAVMADATELKKAATSVFFADLHAPAHQEQFNYIPLKGWDADNPANPIAKEFAERLHAATPADIRSPIAHRTPETSTNVRHFGLSCQSWAMTVLKVQSITLETSYQGNGKTYYTIADYRRLGAALAQTIGRWLL